jgi:arylsulfatase A-like enzyme
MSGSTVAEGQSEPVNIVVIITDDQRYDTIQYMPNVKQKLVREGMWFSKAIASTPLCCPARASFFSGGLYPYETGVLTNKIPTGGAQKYDDTVESLPINLKEVGYTTGMIGKYLNKYAAIQERVPPGWDYWNGMTTGVNYYDFSISVGASTIASPGVGIVSTIHDQYITTYQTNEALSFIDQNAEEAFFLTIAYLAPHHAAVPHPSDENRYNGFIFSSPGTMETDLSDKPSWIGEWQEEWLDEAMTENADFPERQIECLRAIDRGVGQIISKLEEKGILGNTIIIYTSDNGYLWGEHGGLTGKNLAYEESLRVPLIIKTPTSVRSGTNKVVAWNLDIPATIYDLVGIEDASTSGFSLLPLLEGTATTWRSELVIQGYGYGNIRPPEIVPNEIWRGVYTKVWKFVEYPTGERELYNLKDDPYEIENLASDAVYAKMIQGFSNRVKQQTGLTIISEYNLPDATLGLPYSYKLQTWGGTMPLTFALAEGSNLPAGLSLSSDGIISGIPSSTLRYGVNFQVAVTDSSVQPIHNKAQDFTAALKISLT